MFFHEDGRARRLPDEEMMASEPAPVPAKTGPQEQTKAARHKGGEMVPGTKSGKPVLQTPERSHYPIANLSLEAFRSQTDPRQKHEMLIAMITELGNEARAKSVKNKLLKTVIEIFKDINEPAPENDIILPRPPRNRSSKIAELIHDLPDHYRRTVDVAYTAAWYYGNPRKSETKESSPKNAGEHNIKTPPPLE